MDEKLTHLDESGRASMVDVGAKPDTERIAVAEGWVIMHRNTLELIQRGNMKKGDVISVARLAGIMGAKRTADLIPLCHPLALTGIAVDMIVDEVRSGLRIEASVRTVGKTGVEMEALTAVSIAALTVYDMGKAVDREMRIEGIRLLEKHGGTRGDYVAERG